MSKKINITDNNEVKSTTIEIVKVSENVEMIKDSTGILYDPSVLYFIATKGVRARLALRDAMNVLKAEKDTTKAVLKYKEFEVSFGRDENFADVLGYIYALEDFMKNQAAHLSSPNFS